MHSLKLPSCLLITLLAAPGCFLFNGGDDDGGQANDDIGETGEPADDGDDEQPSKPSTPSKTKQPLVDGALWSIRWDTEDPIVRAVLAEPGLALANGAHAALIDPADGEPLWGIVPFDDTASALQLRANELIHGRRISLAKGYLWELHHYSLAGVHTDIEVFPGLDPYGPFAIDRDGRVFMRDDGKLVAFKANGDSFWSRPATEGFAALRLLAIEDGVVLLEVTSLQDLDLDYRLRHFDGDGVELSTNGYVDEFGLIDDFTLADGRAYVAVAGALGFTGRIQAVEPEFAGVAWTVEFGKDTEIEIEPGPQGGLIAVIAEPDVPARAMWIAEDGSVLESRNATTGPATMPLLVVGAGGEVIAGGTINGELQLSRLE